MPSPNLTPPFDLLAAVEPFLMAVWVGFLGACVGSFLNVVIYRLPRRISLVHPGSHCPACGKPIRWYHNLPVFGWLILKGRCRDCGVAISSRYPIIEAVTAVLFISLACVEPLQHVHPLGEPLHLANGWSPVAAWSLCGYHLILLCTLLCLAMIDRDSNVGGGLRTWHKIYQSAADSPKTDMPNPVLGQPLRFPGGLVIGVTVAGFAIPVAWRLFFAGASSHIEWASSTAESLAGGLTAIVCSAMAWPAMAAERTGRATRLYAVSSLWLVGLFLGSRPVVEIVFATAGTHCLLSCLLRIGGRVTWPLILFAVSWAWAVFRLPAMAHANSAATWQNAVANLLGLALLTGLVSVICWRIDRKFSRGWMALALILAAASHALADKPPSGEKQSLPIAWDPYSDTWVATDALGRELPTHQQVGDPRRDRFVGIFYFLWHGQHIQGGPYDVSKILARDPDAMSKPDSPLWGPLHAPHHWGESIFGYYRADDPYVLRPEKGEAPLF